MLGQSENLDDAEIPDLLGNYSCDSGSYLTGSGCDDCGSDIEVQNTTVTVHTMSENDDFGGNGQHNRYELQCFEYFKN
jgi:hypothetical protein